MSLVYKYRPLAGRGSLIKRPIVEMELINGDVRFTTKALIDSGADTCAISSDMANVLGLDLNGEKGMSFGVSGSVESVSRVMTIKLHGAHESYVLNVPVKVLFVDEKESGSFIPLLGRAVLFDSFKVIFEQKKFRVILKHET